MSKDKWRPRKAPLTRRQRVAHAIEWAIYVPLAAILLYALLAYSSPFNMHLG